MPINRKLLEILVCPVTKQPVAPLGAEKLSAVNAQIEKGEISYADGSRVEKPLTEALITANGNTIYRVDENIPVMLEEQSIPCEQIEGF
ncbi:MAG: Trm112 family protein [Pseudomonadota bacterium]|nr:Trm112 family protein [Pseudomonadota bacterium]